MVKSKGWRQEPARHALASKGVKTGHLTKPKTSMHKTPITSCGKGKKPCPVCGQV